MLEDIYDILLRSGLYFGAVFQIFCIAALISDRNNSAGNSDRDGDVSEDDISDQSSPLASPRKPHAHHKARKLDKKKRR